MDVYYEHNGSTFVWDRAKAESNALKHGIRFEEAADVFSDPLFVLVDASRFDEVRDAVIGLDAYGRLLFVVHIQFADDHIRVIPARRATRAEEYRYAG